MLTRALKEVFRKPSYVAIAIIGGFAIFSFAVWLPNSSLIVSTLGNMSVSLGIKTQLLAGLLEGIATNFSAFGAISLILISVLFGINLAMAIYLMKKDVALGRGAIAVGAGGMVSGIFSVGCAACGSFLVSSILSLFGAAGAVTLLPLKGGEFNLASIVLLLASIYFAARRITAPPICLPQSITKP